MLEHYYRHVQMITLDATRRFGSDPVLSLFRGISMLGEGMLKKTNFKRQVKKQLQERQVLNIDNFVNIVV